MLIICAMSEELGAESKFRAELRDEIKAELLPILRDELAREVRRARSELIVSMTIGVVREVTANIKVELPRLIRAELDGQNKMVLATTSQEITQAAVYNKVMADIIPKIDKITQWVGYSLQDTNAVVDEYRRGVEYSSENLITDGKKDKRVIQHGVRTFFADDSDDDL